MKINSQRYAVSNRVTIVPTHEEEPRFWQDWDSLAPEQQAQFMTAIGEMVEDLKASLPFRRGLRVKRYKRQKGTYEVSWAGDGRAIFRFGSSKQDGDAHIIWMRIGTHDIFK